MNFLIAAKTDCGLRKKANQDSLCVMRIQSSLGPMAFAVLCDGMGGLEKGEQASAAVVKAFRRWAVETLPQLCASQLEEQTIREQWLQIAREQNQHIKHYADRLNIRIGTTAVVLLLTQSKYYILNVGDSRAYEIGNSIRQITWDQSLVAREVAAGRLTAAEAEKDSRRNILLQCIGGADQVVPDVYFGDICKDAVYMLCSDGFRHEISPEEFLTAFYPPDLQDEESMGTLLLELIDVNKSRNERDNISALLIKFTE